MFSLCLNSAEIGMQMRANNSAKCNPETLTKQKQHKNAKRNRDTLTKRKQKAFKHDANNVL